MKYPGPSRFRADHGEDRRRAAVTLGELLAIMAIIAVVAAILFPVFASRRQNVRSPQFYCLSHMKLVGLAFGQYLNDYDERYPTYDNDRETITGQPPEQKPNESRGREWFTVLQPYLPFRSYKPTSENNNVLRCPADTTRAPGTRKKWLRFGGEEKVYASSYTLNGWSEYDLSLSAVKSPGSWVLMGERNNQTRGPSGTWRFYFWTWQGTPRVWPPSATPVPTDKAAEDLALTQHGEGANWLYGDGHVKWGRFSDLWKGGSENPFWPNSTTSP